MILVHLHEPVTMDELKKKLLKDIVHIVQEQIIQNARGNIHKECVAYKQAESDHFESFFQFL